MSNNEKILYYRNLSKTELRDILSNKETLPNDDIIIASFELGSKEISDGEYFTTKEVLENVFGENCMVK